jgi:hypothetical protein
MSIPLIFSCLFMARRDLAEIRQTKSPLAAAHYGDAPNYPP